MDYAAELVRRETRCSSSGPGGVRGGDGGSLCGASGLGGGKSRGLGRGFGHLRDFSELHRRKKDLPDLLCRDALAQLILRLQDPGKASLGSHSTDLVPPKVAKDGPRQASIEAALTEEHAEASRRCVSLEEACASLECRCISRSQELEELAQGRLGLEAAARQCEAGQVGSLAASANVDTLRPQGVDGQWRRRQSHIEAEVAASTSMFEARMQAEAANARTEAAVAEADASVQVSRVRAAAIIAEADAEASAAVRRARTRAQAAEVCAQRRVERFAAAEHHATAMSTAISGLKDRIPPDLTRRMHDAEIALGRDSMGSTTGNAAGTHGRADAVQAAVAALRDARVSQQHLEHEMNNASLSSLGRMGDGANGEPSCAMALVVAWAALLASALDAVLCAWTTTAAAVAAAAETAEAKPTQNPAAAQSIRPSPRPVFSTPHSSFAAHLDADRMCEEREALALKLEASPSRCSTTAQSMRLSPAIGPAPSATYSAVSTATQQVDSDLFREEREALARELEELSAAQVGQQQNVDAPSECFMEPQMHDSADAFAAETFTFSSNAMAATGSSWPASSGRAALAGRTAAASSGFAAPRLVAFPSSLSGAPTPHQTPGPGRRAGVDRNAADAAGDGQTLGHAASQPGTPSTSRRSPVSAIDVLDDEGPVNFGLGALDLGSIAPDEDVFSVALPEAELSLSIGDVQRSVALDRSRMEEEKRTRLLHIGLQRCQARPAGQGHSNAVPVPSIAAPRAGARRRPHVIRSRRAVARRHAPNRRDVAAAAPEELVRRIGCSSLRGPARYRRSPRRWSARFRCPRLSRLRPAGGA